MKPCEECYSFTEHRLCRECHEELTAQRDAYRKAIEKIFACTTDNSIESGDDAHSALSDIYDIAKQVLGNEADNG